MLISFPIFLICISFIIFFFLFFQREHYLILLLMLELVVMLLILGFPMIGAFLGMTSTPLVLVLLVMGACEASVGLSVMVYLVRFHGSDLLKSVSLGGV